MNNQPVILTNGEARVVIIPEVGARVISFWALGREWLWRNPSFVSDRFQLLVDPEVARRSTTLGDWVNWGGDKSWPAPQGWSNDQEWAGPPDPILDSGHYEASVSPDRLSCQLTSQDDPRTGLRLQRDVSMRPGHQGLSLTTTMTNISATTRTWACWSVTQVLAEQDLGENPESVVINQTAGALAHVVLFDAAGQPMLASDEHGNLEMQLTDFVGKLGFPSASGVLKFKRTDGSFFQQSFAIEENKPYPDQGSRAEVWMQFPVSKPLESLQGVILHARLVEMECLSPIAELLPGESVSLKVEWLVGEA